MVIILTFASRQFLYTSVSSIDFITLIIYFFKIILDVETDRMEMTFSKQRKRPKNEFFS